MQSSVSDEMGEKDDLVEKQDVEGLVKIVLERRDKNQPWGFRLAGGKDEVVRWQFYIVHRNRLLY